MNIVTDMDGRKLVLIRDIKFKAKKREDWEIIEEYLKGAVAKAKANAAQVIPELIATATDPKHEANRKDKHRTDARYGWYRYDIRFALPVYDDTTGKVVRYNIYTANMLVRYADDGKKYLYDILAIKKETSSPLE